MPLAALLPSFLFFIALVLVACLSPLLTVLSLWQLKEWRWDRIREHLDREGWLLTLFGRLRPAVAGVCFLLLFLPSIRPQWLPFTLIVFAVMTFLQIAFRRQRMPVWTSKAMMTVVVSCLLNILLITLLLAVSIVYVRTFGRWLLTFLSVLVLLQPFVVALAWIFLWPLDGFLKGRIMRTAKQLRDQYPALTVIGITGSVGKTTTKLLLAHVLAPLGAVATPAYVNSEMGVAKWMIETINSNTPPILIVEMGAYRQGEIALMSTYVQQTMAVVTYVGTQHMALFGSQEALFQAKSEIVTHLPPTGHAFINGDNELCRQMVSLAPCPVTVVGTGGNADVEAFDIEETRRGIRFRTGKGTFDVGLHGTHNVSNILLTIAVARHLGMDDTVIRERLAGFVPPSHTFSVREERGVRILDDTHNSSPSSVEAAIAWARSQPEEPKTLLMAGLIELGEMQERVHEDLGARAAGVFDRVIFIDEKMRPSFEKGFGKKVEAPSATTESVHKGSLLVCVGRMPLSKITSLLPHSNPESR